jgi:predicted GNAT family acetyltransferase
MDLSERVDVVDNSEKSYYEVRVAGQTAGAMLYRRVGRRRAIQAAAIDEEFRGRGLAQALMSQALDDIRAHGETISSHCPILDRFLVDNPQYQDLVDPGYPVRALRDVGHDAGPATS